MNTVRQPEHNAICLLQTEPSHAAPDQQAAACNRYAELTTRFPTSTFGK